MIYIIYNYVDFGQQKLDSTTVYQEGLKREMLGVYFYLFFLVHGRNS